MRIPHPIQYQGSKRVLAPTILRYLPRSMERFVEPFAGSGALSIACAALGRAKSFWINDLNKPLADLLNLIVNRPKEVADAYERTWNGQTGDSLEHYYRVREDFNRSGDPRLFLYLLARCVKGSVRYNADGLFNQSPDKRRRGTRPETMRANIVAVSRLLRGKAVVSCMDYRDVLANVNEADVVYMDPPYQGVCGDRDSRYFAGVDFDGFAAALSDLNRRSIRFAVSYDGRTGGKTFGRRLPGALRLTHIQLEAGRSSQATLLGRKDVTVESLYLSAPLAREMGAKPRVHRRGEEQRLMFEVNRR
ncbi:DNA adenine methylase [bacterium]|nr:DNA adenine methylase [bacterium]